MVEKNSFKDVVEEACQLVRASATRRGTVLVSPETAEQFQQLDAVLAARRNAGGARSGALPCTVAVHGAGGGAGPVEVAKTLDELREVVGACTKCSLAETRRNVVFGSGNFQARLVFVGEAPGYEEDVQGKPFVGRAGQLLTDIIEKGMNLKRDTDVYICNVLKCRPPENRNPRPDEIECCEPFLIRQLEIIRPRVICALGTFAAQTLLKTKVPIGQLRGKWHFYHGIPLRATYHPAYLLRNPADKRKTWMDVLEVLKVYNGEEDPKPQS